jgi:hypothetical protein
VNEQSFSLISDDFWHQDLQKPVQEKKDWVTGNRMQNVGMKTHWEGVE